PASSPGWVRRRWPGPPERGGRERRVGGVAPLPRRRRRALSLLGALAAVAVAGGAIVGARAGPDWHRGVASVFFQYGTPLACGGRLDQEMLGVAHRTLPCGAPVTFRHHGRTLTVPVVDRGPFVAGRDF